MTNNLMQEIANKIEKYGYFKAKSTYDWTAKLPNDNIVGFYWDAYTFAAAIDAESDARAFAEMMAALPFNYNVKVTPCLDSNQTPIFWNVSGDCK